MLRHTLAAAYRAIARHLGFSTVNVVGLALGLATCLLILVYIVDEMSYDRQYEKGDRIVRLALEKKGGDEVWRGQATTFYALGDLVQEAVPGVDRLARLAGGRALIGVGDTHLMEDDILFASPSALDVFTIPFVRGNRDTAFDGPFSAVLTEDAARTYFGDEDPIGRRFTYDNEQEFEVTGIVRSMPVTSHFHFDILLNLESTTHWYSREMFESPGAQWIYTYLLLDESVSPKGVERAISDLIEQNMPPGLPIQIHALIQPISDIHLRSNLQDELEPNGRMATIYVFGAIAIFILIIAGVNFVNLSTARASLRAREVGVRKAFGAGRGQLVRQFLGEAVALALVTVPVVIALVALALPAFNQVSGKAVAMGTFLHPAILAGLLGFTLIVGLLAGSYPALYLSSFRPAHVLKNVLPSTGSGLAFRLRQGLVVLQFGISIAIIIATLVVSGQLDFMTGTYPGFDRDQILTVRLPGDTDETDVETLKHAFENVPGVSMVSSASHIPTEGLNSWWIRPEGTPADARELVSWIAVDDRFTETLGLTVREGRSFRRGSASDEADAIVINEAAARFFGLDDPVGTRFRINGGLTADTVATVIGVVEDFQQASLHESIRPLFLFRDPFYRHILLRVDTDRTTGLLAGLEDAWDTHVADWPFEYSFLNDRFDALYSAERRMARIFRAFSFLAIFIAAIGLFGLSAYIAERRSREVGLRKVLGASVPSVVGLLVRDFVRLVAIAFALGAPLAWFVMQRWLSAFPYRASLGAGVFVVTAAVVLTLTLLSVGWQTMRAALTNPVETLRVE